MTEYPAVVHLKAVKSIIQGEKDADSAIHVETDEENKESQSISNAFWVENQYSDSSLIEPEQFQNFVKKLLLSFNEEVTKKLDSIEQRLDLITGTCDVMEEKVDRLATLVNDSRAPVYVRSSVSPCSASSEDSCGASVPITSGITFITLNTKDDYPNGSWLGDENNPELRVRCQLKPTELFHINTTCTSAEKMALTLLDYLFDRETQACSNISGTGKHKKKQLDPLLIYGIQCHLICHFGITEQEWNRIKQNIDSKCRTAFRRKIKGLPLTPKGGHPGHRMKSGEETVTLNNIEGVISSFSFPISTDSILTTMSEDEENMETQSVASSVDENVLHRVIQEAELISTQHGDIQVLRATPDQLAQIQQTHQIQFLTGGHILATPVNDTSEHLNDKGDTQRVFL